MVRTNVLRRPGLLPALAVLAAVALSAPSGAWAQTFSNPAPITINDGLANCAGEPSPAPTPASPYPSEITVSGLTGTVTDVKATLTGLGHTFPDDVDVLLVGPGGEKAMLMADVGGGVDVSGIDLTFDGGADASLADEGQLASGTFRRPTSGTSPLGCATPTSFPVPAPVGPYGSSLSVFDGTGPNGTWSLYIIDDTVFDSGSIDGGWSLDIRAVGGGEPGGGQQPGGGGRGDPPASDTQAPLVGGFRAAPPLFAVARAGTPLAAGLARGTRFRYTLSEPAQVTLTIQHALPGRLAGVRCVRPSPRLRQAERCTRYRSFGALSRSGQGGANSTRFTGRLGKRALRPGRYRVLITAIDAAGNRSAPRTARFRVAGR